MKNNKIKTSFLALCWLKAQASKTEINSMTFFNVRGKLSVKRCYT